MTSINLKRFGNVTIVWDENEDVVGRYGYHFDGAEMVCRCQDWTASERARKGYSYQRGRADEEYFIFVNTIKRKATVNLFVGIEDIDIVGDEWGYHAFDIEFTANEVNALIRYTMQMLEARHIAEWRCQRMNDPAYNVLGSTSIT